MCPNCQTTFKVYPGETPDESGCPSCGYEPPKDYDYRTGTYTDEDGNVRNQKGEVIVQVVRGVDQRERERHAQIGAAIEGTTRMLPDGWHIAIEVEKGSAGVLLFNTYGESKDFPSNRERLSEEISDAVEFARKCEGLFECEFCGDTATRDEWFDRIVPVCDACSAEAEEA